MQDLRAIGRLFRHTTLFILTITTLVIGGLWIYSNYSNFNRESRELKEKYIASQKDLIRREVDAAIQEIDYHRSKTRERLKESIRERVYEAYAIAMNIYESNRDTKSNREIEEMIAEVFSGVTYDRGRGYYFGGRVREGLLLFANGSEYEGRKMLNYQTPQGRYLFREIADIVQLRGEEFYEYTWIHPGEEKECHRKVSFVKIIEPLGLWIGTGKCYEDFQREVRESMLERISRITFGKSGRIFVRDIEGGDLSLGKEGQNTWSMREADRIGFIQKFKRIAEGSEGSFLYYRSPEEDLERSGNRAAFVRGVPQWEWIVGAEVSLDEVENTIALKREALRERALKDVERIAVIIFFIGTLAIFIELRVLKRIKEIIRYEENLYRTLLNLSPEGIYIEDHRGEILDCNKNAYEMMGYSKEELLNLSLSDLKEVQNLPIPLEVGGREVTFKRKDGTYLTGELNTASIEVGRERRQVTFLKDITERKKKEKHLEKLSIRDDLTKLYNRNHIFRRLELEVEKFKRNGVPFSLSLIDIDHFKGINDTFGHIMGDEVLRRIAKVLEENLRDSDFVGRYGGEEFLILLPNTRSEEAFRVMERIRALTNELSWEKDLTTTFSGGIIDVDSENVHCRLEEIIHQVDQLLYRAKKGGRNRIEVERSRMNF